MKFASLLLTSILVMLLSIGAALGPPAAAQEAQPAAASAVELLERGGNTVFVVPPATPAPAVVVPPPPTLQDRVAAFRLAMAPVIAAIPAIPSALAAAMVTAGGGTTDWVLPALLVAALSIGIGTAAYLYAGRLCSRIVFSVGFAAPETRAGKIGGTLERLIRAGLATAAFYVAGTVVALLLEPTQSPARAVALVSVLGITTFLAVRTVLVAILSPHDGTSRLVPFTDTAARSFYFQIISVGVVAATLNSLAILVRRIEMDAPVEKALTVLAATGTLVLFLVVILGHRKEITAAILGSVPRPGIVRRTASIFWPFLIVVYFVGAWMSRLIDVAFDQPQSTGPIVAPSIGVVAALMVTGVLFIIHDSRLKKGIVNAVWSELFERTAVGIGAIVGVGVMLAVLGTFEEAWGPVAERALGIAIVLLVAWAAWQAVRTWVTLRLEEEAGPVGGQDTENEGFGPGGSRLATLLPILRSVMAFVIGSVVVMFVLANLGVNVAPLFAGAGVVGLAVGFGAQSLIRDIFSGAFFLLDDAFRKGEYVDVGGTMGAVERISVRSFQLRHQEGRLHTIPFGEIKQLTNFSRDWVIMKLPVRLTYDTDVEKVRKLVKKLGQQMAADPEIGHYFIEPPKSQGVVQMDDSAMIMRVKFKTKPGDQFMVRRHVYQRLRDVFDENDIHFAHREVLVRVAGTDDPEQRRQAALGAVRAMDDQGKPAKVAGDLG